MVFPMLRVLNIDGALTSYQSFFVNGSTLHQQQHTFNRSYIVSEQK